LRYRCDVCLVGTGGHRKKKRGREVGKAGGKTNHMCAMRLPKERNARRSGMGGRRLWSDARHTRSDAWVRQQTNKQTNKQTKRRDRKKRNPTHPPTHPPPHTATTRTKTNCSPRPSFRPLPPPATLCSVVGASRIVFVSPPCFFISSTSAAYPPPSPPLPPSGDSGPTEKNLIET
jgi:hypothetical protein